jgi:hypothetical protein
MSLTTIEIIAQAKALVETKASVQHFKTMAKAILLDVAKECTSPTALKRKMKPIKDTLKAEFENVNSEYKTCYKDYENFCLVSYLNEFQTLALDNNNPNLRASDYPQIMQRIYQITGEQPPEASEAPLAPVEASEAPEVPVGASEATISTCRSIRSTISTCGSHKRHSL